MTHYADTLSLLSLKIAPNVFDLSSGQHHVSIRDQIVRGQLLARDLRAADPSATRYLVIGAGVAGVAAAFAASKAGPHVSVYVVDTEMAPFSRQVGVTSRFVGPFMYEWPDPLHANQSYPPTGQPWSSTAIGTPAWASSQPLSANDLALQLTAWLQGMLSLPHPPRFYMGANAEKIQRFVQRFVSSLKRLGPLGIAKPLRSIMQHFLGDVGEVFDWKLQARVPALNLMPDYIILGTGLGQETTTVPNTQVTGAKFWANDTLKNTTTSAETTVILGGGDGAMQDLIRAATPFDHPLQFVTSLAGTVTGQLIKNAEPMLAAAERESRLYATWTESHDAFRHVDEVCRLAAEGMAQNAAVLADVSQCMRQGAGKVALLTKEAHFTKAYLLNRFVSHLIIACSRNAKGQPSWNGLMDVEQHFNARAKPLATPGAPFSYSVDYETWPPGASTPTHTATVPCHLVIVRFGIDGKTIPAMQMISVSGKHWRARTLHGRIPVPHVVPK